jgi:ferredoxin-nitrate reductase
MDIVKTLCPYCGVGCGLEVVGKNNQNQDLSGWKVRGDRDHPSSQGMICVKGATIIESVDVDRLRQPMVRQSLDQPFQPISWDEALDLIVSKINAVRQTLGSDGLCMYGSGQFQTEDYYVAQKLFKGCLGTNNFDANSRLCMSSAVSGYVQSFGADGPPCCYDDLEKTECAFLIGTNTAECHPIVFNRLRKHHKGNANVKMIVVDPRRTPTAEAADLYLAIKPGTDIALLNGIAHLLLAWGKQDQNFIDRHTNGFAEFAELVKAYPPEQVAQTCGISVEDLEMAARYWSESARVLSMWSMGINQSSQGTAKAQAVINLHLLTAQIGKPGAGPFSLTGQPNAMGGREAGGLAHLLPGYRSVTNPQHRAELEWFWRLPPRQISDRPGRSAWEIVRGLEDDEIGLLWIAATNPVVSFPDLGRTKAALRRSPFTIYQDAYYPTETSAYAHLLLPATQWSEKTGTMTNSERMVSLCPAFHKPIGESRDDWAVFAEVGRRLGFADKFKFTNSAQVYAEFAQITRDRPCDHSGISHQLLAKSPIQWPQPASSSSPSQSDRSNSNLNHQPKRLYQDYKFHTPDGRARFGINHNNGLAEPTDPDYPFVLTVGRLYGHWHTQTRTGRINKIKQMYPQPFIEIHPRDAEAIAATEGSWLEVKSRRGAAKFLVKITKAIAPGVVFVPMHWGALWAKDAEANSLTHSQLDPISLQPELKACAVRLRVLSALEVAPQSADHAGEPNDVANNAQMSSPLAQ